MSILQQYFPNQIKSDEAEDYNCIAWAAGDNTQWWEPDVWGNYYWPPNVPRQITLDAFIKAYETLGFVRCRDGKHEDNIIKIALYVDAQGIPTHAARLLPNGKWTSKCGIYEDIEHELKELCGPPLFYGNIACYMKKPA